MNEALQEVDLWFKRNKLNLNPSKTLYLIFNAKTKETNLVKIGSEYLQRVQALKQFTNLEYTVLRSITNGNEICQSLRSST